MTPDAFSAVARQVAAKASHMGLTVPAYRGRHGMTAHRYLGRFGADGTVTVFIDLSLNDNVVIDAMIDGTLAANRIDLDDWRRVDLDPRQLRLL